MFSAISAARGNHAAQVAFGKVDTYDWATGLILRLVPRAIKAD
jgi:hypothetical protein